MPFSDFFPKVSQAPSKCFFKWINWIKWIKSRIPRWIWKIIFVLSSYEFLTMLEGKIRKCPFSQGSIWWNNSVKTLPTVISDMKKNLLEYYSIYYQFHILPIFFKCKKSSQLKLAVFPPLLCMYNNILEELKSQS